MTASRILLGIASLIMLVGGVVHARAFVRFDAALAATSLPSFYASSARGLWLIDSSTQVILAAAFGWMALRPDAATPVVVALLGLIPAATAALIYLFVGNFIAGHLLAAAAVAALIAAALPASR